MLYVLFHITRHKIRNIDKTKNTQTLKYHQFEVVTCEILGFEGAKYKEVDQLSWFCAVCIFLHH